MILSKDNWYWGLIVKIYCFDVLYNDIKFEYIVDSLLMRKM